MDIGCKHSAAVPSGSLFFPIKLSRMNAGPRVLRLLVLSLLYSCSEPCPIARIAPTSDSFIVYEVFPRNVLSICLGCHQPDRGLDRCLWL